jgi:ribose transport system ATP-binding protein
MAEVTMSSSTAPRLAMHGIRRAFGATIALGGVDLTVQSGETHALVGENGAGKSTLMKVLSGAVRPDAGTMELDGVRYAPRNAQEAREAGVAMIYQELSLAPHLSVADNIMLGMEPTSLGMVRRSVVRQKTLDALRQLGHESISPDATVSSLSIAAQQIVEIARALAIGCRVLVLDEPTSSLTLQDIEHLFTVITRLRNQGHAVVYISHFLEEVKRVTDSLTVLRDGKTVGGGETAEFGIADIVSLMVGRQVDELYPRTQRSPGEALLEVQGLSGSSKLLSASFNLHRGEIFGIAGLIGAGRTELLRALFGLDSVRQGKIRLGVYSGTALPSQRWRQGAGLLSEDRGKEGLALPMSISDNITMNLERDSSRIGFLSPSRLEATSARWIQRLGIRSIGPRQRVGSLSGGNQQKVAIARLLHQDVDVLLLDEPTRGIDVASKSQIYELVNALASGDPAQGRKPKAVLIVSSYLPELLGLCDRIAVMCRGHLGNPRAVKDFDEHSLMVEATGQGTTA